MTKEDIEKQELARKHIGANTPEWILDKCVELLNDFENQIQSQPLQSGEKECKCEHAYGEIGCAMVDLDQKCTPYPEGSKCSIDI